MLPEDLPRVEKSYELTVEEQDLVMSLRRLEMTYGKGNIQSIIFKGDDQRAETVRQIILSIEQCAAAEFDGDLHYLIIKVPDEEPRKGVLYREALEQVDLIFYQDDEQREEMFFDEDVEDEEE